MIAGIAVTAIGVMLFTVAVPAALLTTGTGVLVTVVGLIATVATVKLCIVMYPGNVPYDREHLQDAVS